MTTTRAGSAECPCRQLCRMSMQTAARAIRALMIPMIQTAFRARPMAVASGADRPAATTRRRAIRMTAITRGAHREQAATEPAAFLAKRGIHDVGAGGPSDWTRTSNRGTRDTTDSVRRSIEAVTEGLEVLRSSPHLVRGPRSVRDVLTIAQAEEAVDAGAAMDAQNAPTAAWKSRRERTISTSAHKPHLLLQTRSTKNTYHDPRPDLRGFR